MIFSGDWSFYEISLVYWFTGGGIGSIFCYGFVWPSLHDYCSTEGQAARDARIEANIGMDLAKLSGLMQKK